MARRTLQGIMVLAIVAAVLPAGAIQRPDWEIPPDFDLRETQDTERLAERRAAVAALSFCSTVWAVRGTAAHPNSAGSTQRIRDMDHSRSWKNRWDVADRITTLAKRDATVRKVRRDRRGRQCRVRQL